MIKQGRCSFLGEQGNIWDNWHRSSNQSTCSYYIWCYYFFPNHKINLKGWIFFNNLKTNSNTQWQISDCNKHKKNNLNDVPIMLESSIYVGNFNGKSKICKPYTWSIRLSLTEQLMFISVGILDISFLLKHIFSGN